MRQRTIPGLLIIGLLLALLITACGNVTGDSASSQADPSALSTQTSMPPWNITAIPTAMPTAVVMPGSTVTVQVVPTASGPLYIQRYPDNKVQAADFKPANGEHAFCTVRDGLPILDFAQAGLHYPETELVRSDLVGLTTFIEKVSVDWQTSQQVGLVFDTPAKGIGGLVFLVSRTGEWRIVTAESMTDAPEMIQNWRADSHGSFGEEPGILDLAIINDRVYVGINDQRLYDAPYSPNQGRPGELGYMMLGSQGTGKTAQMGDLHILVPAA